MKIFNTQVYGISETAHRSGYPMSPDIKEWGRGVPMFKESLSYKRMCKLGNAPIGSGHDCSLKGIIVQCDIEAPNYWWPQFQRYHFADIISSQSKMHRIDKIVEKIKENEETPPNVDFEVWDKYLDMYEIYRNKGMTEEQLIANTPMGLELTAAVVMNYLQIKTMYAQRFNHRLRMWNTVFKEWVEGLPYAREFGLTGGFKNDRF